MMRDTSRAAGLFRHRKQQALTGEVTPLKHARLSAFDGAGMTSASLAALAGISRYTLSKAEAGDPVSVRTRRKLTDALGIPAEDLFP